MLVYKNCGAGTLHPNQVVSPIPRRADGEVRPLQSGKGRLKVGFAQQRQIASGQHTGRIPPRKHPAEGVVHPLAKVRPLLLQKSFCKGEDFPQRLPVRLRRVGDKEVGVQLPVHPGKILQKGGVQPRAVFSTQQRHQPGLGFAGHRHTGKADDCPLHRTISVFSKGASRSADQLS